MKFSAVCGVAAMLFCALLGATVASAAHPLVAEIGGCADTEPERELTADPSDFSSIVASLGPGDRLTLAPGQYNSRLQVHDLHGETDRCIIIEGPTDGGAVFVAQSSANTISISNSHHVVIRHLSLDGTALPNGATPDAVKAEGYSSAEVNHHITIEGLQIDGYSTGSVYPVAISTKSVAYNWVIRKNRIVGAGTGLYLGNSNGERDFSNSLIEHNVILNTRGYNGQIKHQHARSTDLGAPATGITVIRHNVFSKASGSATGNECRPNLLVGHRPPTGAGSEDDYLIYGNFFWQNECTSEALFQGEGHIILYDNLLVNDHGTAIRIQNHNDVPKRIRVFHNTVVAEGSGIRMPNGGDPAYQQKAFANAVFASIPLYGVPEQHDNVTGEQSEAAAHLENPFGSPGAVGDELDLYPLAGALSGDPVDLGDAPLWFDTDRDFNDALRPGTYRGAYSGDGSNPGWLPELDFKPEPSLFSDGFESGDTDAWSSVTP
ncbi:MAG: hypothetical protein GY906_35880 [bacterium]|nr:hypothetical protein [bacterium]